MEYGTVLLIPLVHELGHYVAALAFGSRLRFTFEWGKLGPIPVPRWTWRWPDVTKSQLRIICLAGFGLEFAILPFMPCQYAAGVLIHFAAYPWYAGETSDFKGMI